MDVVLTGGAGLVGQNFVTLVEARPDLQISVIGKDPHDLGILRRLHPHVSTILADLAEPGPWESAVARADVVVLLNAQISALRLSRSSATTSSPQNESSVRWDRPAMRMYST